MKLVIAILAGGSGSRLWPVSRENYPKPFIRLADNQSLLQKALLRGVNLPSLVEVITVTNHELLFLTIDDFETVQHKPIPKSFILEPEGRNTAPAITAATLEASNKYGEDVFMLILPADHIIQNQKSFEDAVDKALTLASRDKLVTFGVNPKNANSGYGYIETEGSNVKRFIEKPSLEKANEYISQGNFYWNAGIFCFKAKAFIDEMKLYAEPILEGVFNAINHSRRETEGGYPKIFLDINHFQKIIPNSIDYALLEKSKNIAVVSSDLGWSDVGSWLTLTNLIDQDNNGNRIQGKTILHSTKNSSIFCNNRMVALIGVSNLIVVETDDAILIVDKSYSEDVRFLFENLKDSQNDLYRLHNEVYRPWGSYKVLCEDQRYKVKRILVKPYQEISLQKHKYRAEHWVVVKGKATIINNDKKITLNENESTYIPKGNVHQLINQQDIMLEIIEIQSGHYLGEDDIIRIHDKYKRNPQ